MLPGYPDAKASTALKIVSAMVEAGADIIEVGIRKHVKNNHDQQFEQRTMQRSQAIEPLGISGNSQMSKT